MTTVMTQIKKHHTMNKRLTPIIILTSALWLFGLSAKAQTIGGSVYGGGNKAAVTGTVRVEISAGEVKKNVFGGGNEAGINNTTGQTDGTATVTIEGGIIGSHTESPSTYGVYGGCNTSGTVKGDVEVNITGGTLGSNASGSSYRLKGIYGGGKGSATETNGDVTVTIEKASGSSTGPVIYGDVYGGSALGKVNTSGNTTEVDFKEGTLNGTVYGGGMGDDETAALVNGDIEVAVASGTTTSVGVYGGCNVNGTVKGSVNVGVSGTVNASGNATGVVYGGGLGEKTVVNGSVAVSVGTGAAIYGDVYGGSAKGLVNCTYANSSYTNPNNDTTGVKLNAGVIYGNLYGGGHGLENQIAHVYGPVTVVAKGGTVNNVFGCNNLKGSPQSTVEVNTENGVTINNNVFGGGNQADYTGGSPVVNIKGGTVKQSVFGGGNEAGVGLAAGTSTTQVNVSGGTVGNATTDTYGIYGGCNTSGTVNGDIEVSITGGTLGQTGASAYTLKGIYGGGKGKDTRTTDDILVKIGEGSAPIIYGDVYGGSALGWVGDNASDDLTKVDFKNGTLYGNLYGGGMGDTSDSARVISAVQVNIADGTIHNSIYGGCNYKGGVGGRITVNVTGGTIGSSTNLNGSSHITADVFGGGYGEKTAANSDVVVNFGVLSDGTSSTHNDFPKLYGDIYGGSALGRVNTHAAQDTTYVNIYNGTLFTYKNTEGQTPAGQNYYKYYGGNVYGGGLGQKDVYEGGNLVTNNSHKGKVYGPIIVSVGDSIHQHGVHVADTALYFGCASIGGNVYGCNNTNGSPEDFVTVNIFGTHHVSTTSPAFNDYVTGTDFAIDNVFGGGNEASYTATGKQASVKIFGCDNTIERSFGGGNAAAAPNVFTDIQGGRFKEVYGGGNGELGPSYAADITGNVTLAIHGGNVGQFFIGSNQNGTISGSATSTVDNDGPCGEIEIDEYFCGGNYADFVGNIDATIECSTTLSVRNLYGGCNQANVVPKGTPGAQGYEPGNVHLTVKGGSFENVYGGSKGTPAKPANIAGDVVLDIFGGVIDTVFGGSNINGNVNGKIIVNVFDNDSCNFEVRNVYGGGRDASYTPTTSAALAGNYPEVNIMHGIISKTTLGTGGNVFGGGYGLGAIVTSNPKVRIGYDGTMADYLPYATYNTVFPVADRQAKVNGIVFGGGDMADVAGATKVIIQQSHSSASSLFGGGNKASVGNATVNVLGGSVTAGVYGGCNESGTVGGYIDTHSFSGGDLQTNSVEYYGTINVDLSGGKVGANTNTGRADVYGGGFGGGDNGTFTKGHITVTLRDNAEVYGDLYGGSAFGSVNSADSLTKVNIRNSKLYGTVFGGGKGQLQSGNDPAFTATTNGNVEVNIEAANTDGHLKNIYGGANVKGNVVGDIDVNIKANVGNTGNVLDTIFGGGLGAATTTGGDVTVTIGKDNTTPTIYGDVYGGSALGGVNTNTNNLTKVDFKNGTLNGVIFGGGMGQNNPNIAAMVNGKTEVAVANGTISGGVYGGCNERGTVSGDIAVNIEGGTVGTSATDRANIHGGGLGNNTATSGDVTVTFGAKNNAHQDYPKLYGDLYGGSGYGNVNSNTSNKTTVNVINGEITGDVYGGGLGQTNPNNYAAQVNGGVEVNIGATINEAFYGKAQFNTYGTNGANGGNVFGCNNANGTPKGNVVVNVRATHHGTDVAHNLYPTTSITTAAELAANAAEQTYAIQSVYGGGNLAAYVPAAEKSTTVHVYNCDNTIKEVYGGGNAANVGSTGEGAVTTNTFVYIDGGRINKVFGGGKGVKNTTAANIYGIATTTIYAGLIDTIFGGSNQNGSITSANLDFANTGTCTDKVFNQVFGGANVASISSDLATTINCGTYTFGDIYGGSNLAGITGDVTLNINGGTYNYVFGGSKGASGESNAANINGNVNLNLYGGTITNAFGGSNINGNVTGKIKVDVLDQGSCDLLLTNVYGGGKDASYKPTDATQDWPEVNIKHIAQNHSISNVYGGGYGSTAEVKSNPKVTIGDTESSHYAAISNNVYGGGEQAPVTGNTKVIMQNAHASALNVYGGGNLANVSGSTLVNVNGGTVTQDVYGGGALADVGSNTSVTLSGGTTRMVFGGGMGDTDNSAQVTGTSTVNINTGATVTGNDFTVGTGTSVVTVKGAVFGGCNVNGSIGGAIVVNPNGGSITGNVYGGGLGENTTTGKGVTVTVDGASITGDVYGGSALGKVNNTTTDITKVWLKSGSISSNIYGGGMGQTGTENVQKGQVNGQVQVLVDGGTVSNVFGCNNYNGAPQGIVTVNINSNTGNVYGGGNLAAYSHSEGNYPEVNINKGTVANVFGGGLGSSAAVTGSPKVTIGDASTAAEVSVTGNVYGGGDEAQVTGSTLVTLQRKNENGAATTIGKNVYGGGNKAKVTVSTSVDMTDGYVTEDVYGGGALANVETNTSVSISGGSTRMVFGGGMGDASNSAQVAGTSTVAISGNGAVRGYNIGTSTNPITGAVFGGCNVNGSVGGAVVVNPNGGSIAGNVYGGGLGESTTTGAGVTVTVDGASITGDVYGGSALGKVNNTTTDITKVWLKSGTISNNIYGGGMGQTGDENVQKGQVNGQVEVLVQGGSVASVFGCNNYNGAPQGTVKVDIEGGTVTQDVYGGGNLAHTSTGIEVNINGGTITRDVYGGGAFANTGATTVNVMGGTVTRDIYGGGLGDSSHTPLVNGVVHVNIGQRVTTPTVDTIGDATILGDVYGCNNAAGYPTNNVYVDVWKTHQEGETEFSGNGFAIANVFGGGNQADFNVTDKKANVYIHGCDNTIRRVFGGGNNADAWGVATTIDGGRFDYVFGGGNGEGENHEANIGLGGASLTIMGGKVGQFFGGSNENGTITGPIQVNASSDECELDIENFFCGSNQVYIAGDVNTTITCNGSMNVKNLYGGSNLANIGGNVTLTVEGGTYENVFGGSKGNRTDNKPANISHNVTLNLLGGTITNAYGGSDNYGNIGGKINVNVLNVENSSCPLILHNVYGGGRDAEYTPTYALAAGETEHRSPVVNLIHGTVSTYEDEQGETVGGNVFGGGLGSTATVTCNPVVNVGYNTSLADTVNNILPTGTNLTKAEVVVQGNVYGGGNEASVASSSTITDIKGNTYVTIQKAATTTTLTTVNTSVAGDVYGGGNLANVSGSTTMDVTGGTVTHDVYGGGALANTGGSNVTLNGGQVNDIYGGGLGDDNHPAAVNGDVLVTVTSGTVRDVYGCNNVNGAPTAGVQVDINGAVGHNVYGGGNQALSTVAPIVNINTGADVTGSVFGGGNQAGVGGGNVNMEDGLVRTGLYGGCNTSGTVTGDITVALNGGTVGVSGLTTDVVYGGGQGHDTSTEGNVIVNLGSTTTSGTTVYGNLYGGSALGSVNAGTSNTTTVTLTKATLYGSVFGGGMGEGSEEAKRATNKGKAIVNVDVYNANLTGIYGGANVNGNVAGDIEVNINANVGASGNNNKRDIYGGGLGANTTTGGNVTVTVGDQAGTYQPVVYGDVYGGSQLGSVNDAAADKTTVNFLNGTLHGNIYGGGLGDANDSSKGQVNGEVVVNVSNNDQTVAYCHIDLTDAKVYGCNNTNGSPQDNVTVNIYKTSHNETNAAGYTGENPTYSIKKVFGGGNQASYNPTGTQKTSVIIYGCDNTIEDVFGGGDAASVKKTSLEVNGGRFDRVFAGGNGETGVADIGTGGTSLEVKAGIIRQLFGGSNKQGTISGPITVNLNHDNSECDEDIDEFFGGSNEAAIGTNESPATLNTTIACGVGNITDIYGGSNAADIIGNVTLNIYGGTITNAYGGSKGRLAGDEGGAKAANILDKTNGNGTYGNVTLNLYGGTITNAFGGSNRNGDIDSKITVNMLDNETANCGLTVHNIYGASNLAAYSPNNADLVSPVVNLFHGSVTKSGANTTDGNVYGGAKGGTATVTANPKVNVGYVTSMTLPAGVTSITKAQVSVAGNVYGGGDEAEVTGGTTIMVQRKEASNDYTTAVSGNIFGGGNLANVSEGTIVTLNGGTVTQDVYGGGALANTGGSNVTLAGATVTQDIYGGGLGRAAATGVEPIAAQVTGAVQVTVTSGSVRDVYGCNNVNGSPTNTVTVDIEGPVGNNVYGGGNLATSGITPVVNIMTGANVTGSVFGGGNNASVAGGDVNMQAGTILGGLYGGCNTNGSSGNITVDVTGGTIGASGTPANVHGGGYGNGTSTTGDVEVTINGSSAAIWGDVYGGSAKGHVNDAAADHTNVTLTRGTIHGDLYGGGLGDADNAATVNGAVQVTVNGGTVTGSVYGCNNANGAPQSTVKVDIYGTDTPASGYALANVFGGGNQAAYGGSPEVTIHNCNNSIGYVYGGGNKASVAATNVKVYGGNTIGYVFGGGNGEGLSATTPMVTGNAVANIYGGTIGHVFGGNNSSGAITGTVTVNVDKSTASGACAMYIGEVYGGGNLAAGKAGTINIGCTGTLETLGANQHYGEDKEGIRYVYGGANDADVTGDITLNINSGIVENVFGGNNTGHAVNGKITVNINQTNTSCGWYVGNVFGGGNLALYSAPSATTDYPQVNILNGTVSGDVFGGGLGQTGDAGKVTGNTQVTVNGANAAVNGGVYGGGSLAPTVGNPVVTLSNGTLAKVFGGGKAANVNGAPTVNINGGTVSAGVYGGCDSQGTVSNDITVAVTNGTIGTDETHRADIYGGGYGAGTATQGDVTVNFGTATSAATQHTEYPKLFGDIYGGSALGSVNEDHTNTTMVNVMNGTLKTHRTSGTTSNNQTYYTYAGGNVFGGGLGEEGSDVKGKVNGRVVVNIGAVPTRTRSLDSLHPENDTLIGQVRIEGNVYGCNNTSGSPQDSVMVNIYRTYMRSTDTITYTENDATYAIANVFGGGNKANYVPATTATNKKLKVMVHGCFNTIERVFGGSNAAAAGASGNTVKVVTDINGGRFNEVFGGGNGEVSAANIFGSVDLGIHGGLVNEFYVGSNNSGTISGASNVTVDQTGGCEEVNITEFYCGGKYADFVGDINATITCSQDMHVTNLYGGCKEAHVKAGNGGSGNIHLTVVGGTFENVYGGSRGTQTKGADIEGNITLDIFGGTITKAIYGGSNVKGAIGGTITVNVEDKYPNDNCSLEVSTADVYGGGNQADYPGVPAPDSPITGTITHTSPYNYPEVNIKNATVKNVFGGGLNATVTGNPQIFIKKGSKVLGNVYGGGNMGEVNGNPRVIVNGKQTN